MTFTDAPEQSFASSINDVLYNFVIKYNSRYDYWSMAISTDGAVLAAGVKLVTKTDLLKQYPSIPFEMRSEYKEDANGTNITEFTITVT